MTQEQKDKMKERASYYEQPNVYEYGFTDGYSLRDNEDRWIPVETIPEEGNGKPKKVIVVVEGEEVEPTSLFAIYFKGEFYPVEEWVFSFEDSPKLTPFVKLWQPLPASPSIKLK